MAFGKLKDTCQLVFFLILFEKTLCIENTCEMNQSVDISQGTKMSNGDIYYNGDKYEKSDYYVDSGTGAIIGCLCASNICVRKCCEFGKAYDPVAKQCVDFSQAFDPPVYDHRTVKNDNGSDDFDFILMNDLKAKERFHFVFGKVNCTVPEFRVRLSPVFVNHHLTTNGQLYVEFPPWKFVGPDKYCMDTFVKENENGDKDYRIDYLVCFPEKADTEQTSYEANSICMLISCVFILATVAVYTWLPELRNLHGRVLTAYLLCLFVGFLFMATMQILLIHNKIDTTACLWMTFIIYFFLLAAFFWMNVMSFDIWWTFSGKRNASENVSRRMWKYASYAFGVPTALTMIVGILQISNLGSSIYLPNLTTQGCFIAGTSKKIYFYAPIVFVIVSNIIFFVLTALKIREVKRQTRAIKNTESARHDSQRNKDKQRYFLYIKLFVLMGINWLLEVVSGWWPNFYFWRVTDVYNVLTGFIIFVIFVCKKKMYEKIKNRYKQMMGEPISRTHTTNSSRTASTQNDVRLSVRTSAA